MFLVLCVCLFGPSDWPQWRGPNRNGTAPQFQAAALAEAAPLQVWRVAVGEGYGGVVVAKKRVFVLAAESGHEVVHCLALATGKTLWQYRYPISFKANPYATAYGSGPFSTPLVVGDRVIVVGVTGRVSCLETATGKLLWEQPSMEDLAGDRQLFCGNSVSPLAVGDSVLVHTGNESHGSMRLLALADGKAAWTWREDIPGYASPQNLTVAGTPTIVALTQNSCFGIDPHSGATRWEIPFQVTWRENIVEPLLYKDTLLLSGREQRATTAFILAKDGEGRAAWRNEEVFGYIASPVFQTPYLYGLAHRQKGSLYKQDVRDGKVAWQSPGRLGMGAHLILAGDNLVVLTTEGRLLCYDIRENEPKLIAEHKVAEQPTWGHPAMLTREMVLREKKSLSLLRF